MAGLFTIFNNTNLPLFTSYYKFIVYLLFTSHGTIAYIDGSHAVYRVSTNCSFPQISK